MNEQELERFGEQIKQLGNGTKDLVYYPETGEFECVSKELFKDGNGR